MKCIPGSSGFAALVWALAGCSGAVEESPTGEAEPVVGDAAEALALGEVQSALSIGAGSLGLLPSECQALGCRTERRNSCSKTSWVCICGGGSMCIDEGDVGDSCTRTTYCCNGCCAVPGGDDGCSSRQNTRTQVLNVSPLTRMSR